jgi:F-type H+-transporting ATPase subunit alpha
VNVGISVSRVGGNAQTKAIRAVAGRLKGELAQFREVQAFSQFASDLDKATQAQLARGLRLVEILKQPPYQPIPIERQVAAIFVATNGFLDDLPVASARAFEAAFLAHLDEKYPEVLEGIAKDKAISDSANETLKKAATELKTTFKA